MSTGIIKQRVARLSEKIGLGGFAALALCGFLIGASAVAFTLGLTTGIRALYPAIGATIVLIGAILPNRSPSSYPVDLSIVQLSKLTTALGVFGVSVAFFINRAASFLLFIPAFLVLVGVVLYSEQRPKLAVVSIVLLYGLFSLSKFVGTRYYYGAGDVLGHTLGVRQLLREGADAITYTAYSSFPGLHTATAGIHLVSGLPVYAAYTIVGMVIMTVVVAVTYLFYRLQFMTERIAVVATFLFATFEQTVFFSTYVFPQTLAFGFIIIVFYFGLSLTANSDTRRYLLAGVFSIASAVTHHFTALLLFPAAAVIAVVELLRGGPLIIKVRESRAAQVLTSWVSVILAYWLIVNDWIFDAVGYTLGQTFVDTGGTTADATTESQGTPEAGEHSAGSGSSGAGSESSGADSGNIVDPASIQTTQETYAYGTTGPLDTIERAIVSFAEPTLLYQIAVVALVLFAVYALVRSKYEVSFPSLLLLGVAAVPLIVKTPIQVWSMRRLQMVWVIFFVGFAAIGVRYALQERETATRIIVVGILALAAVSGTLGSADDVSAINLNDDQIRGVALGGDRDQYIQLSTFINRRDTSVSAPWIARETLRSFGSEADKPSFGERVIVSEQDLLLVESDWSEQMFKAEYESGIGLSQVYFSEKSLTRLQSNQNRIYSSGDIMLLYDDDRVHRVMPPTNRTAMGM